MNEYLDIGDIKKRLIDFNPQTLRERVDLLSIEHLKAEAAFKRKLTAVSLAAKYSKTPPLSDKIADMHAYVDPEVEIYESFKIKTYGEYKAAERELEEYYKLHDRDKKLAEIDKALMLKFREE